MTIVPVKKVHIDKTTPKQLNWLVTRCLHPKADMSSMHIWLDTGDGKEDFLIENYAEDWACGGPVLQKLRGLKLEIGRVCITSCYANIVDLTGKELYFTAGKTLLMAGLRCLVLSKLGEQVDVPEALC